MPMGENGAPRRRLWAAHAATHEAAIRPVTRRPRTDTAREASASRPGVVAERATGAAGRARRRR